MVSWVRNHSDGATAGDSRGHRETDTSRSPLLLLWGPERYLDIHLLFGRTARAPHDCHLDLISRLMLIEGTKQRLDAFNRLAIDGYDQVAQNPFPGPRPPRWSQSGLCCGTAGRNRSDECTLHASWSRVSVGKIFGPEHGADYFAVAQKLWNDSLDRIDRNRKSDASRRAGRTVDRSVHPN